MLSIVNIVAKATLESIDLNGYEKGTIHKGRVKCEIWADGRMLLTKGRSEQECRDAAAQCGVVKMFEVINMAATATLPYTLSLEMVADELGVEYNPDEFDGVVYCPKNHETCTVVIMGKGSLVFVGCQDTETYQIVLDELESVFESMETD